MAAFVVSTESTLGEGCGQGCVAVRNIARGELILAETPLLRNMQASDAAADEAKFAALASSRDCEILSLYRDFLSFRDDLAGDFRSFLQYLDNASGRLNREQVERRTFRDCLTMGLEERQVRLAVRLVPSVYFLAEEDRNRIFDLSFTTNLEDSGSLTGKNVRSPDQNPFILEAAFVASFEPFVRRLLQIYANNAIPMPERFLVTCDELEIQVSQLSPTVARFNHSCLPNALFEWREDKQVVLAACDIKKGEEIFVSYLGSACWHCETKERQELFVTRFGFSCACSLCATITGKKNISSDTHRRRIRYLEDLLWSSRQLSPFLGVQSCEELLEIFETEFSSANPLFIAKIAELGLFYCGRGVAEELKKMKENEAPATNQIGQIENEGTGTKQIAGLRKKARKLFAPTAWKGWRWGLGDEAAKTKLARQRYEECEKQLSIKTILNWGRVNRRLAVSESVGRNC